MNSKCNFRVNRFQNLTSGSSTYCTNFEPGKNCNYPDLTFAETGTSQLVKPVRPTSTTDSIRASLPSRFLTGTYMSVMSWFFHTTCAYNHLWSQLLPRMLDNVYWNTLVVSSKQDWATTTAGAIDKKLLFGAISWEFLRDKKEDLWCSWYAKETL